ncbi:nuclear transport factor 2 family protein [Pararhodonellum marinum]|uniref:nuclear transport factor 2 family protein n=1 Tax=Pararhodonellum marinum TaxID=2755358 RepID=UPI00188E8630|nr:nuclear transport factor 2 family protein [Pararhodonellum marinum]
MKPVVQNDVYARQVYELYWDSYLKGDKDTFVSTLDEVFEMNGAPKSEVCEHNFQGLGFLKAQIQGALEKLEMRNREINLVPINSLFLVRECCEIHVLRAETWSFHSKIRISSLIRETASGWKMVQQNVSFPQLSNEDGETKASEILSAENKKLTNLLQRQTTELEQKKRELEIEAALEKVRGRTMVMQDSDELENVATLLFQQVRELGIETWTTGFNVWNEYDTAYTDFVTNPEGGFIKPYVVDLTQFQTFIEIREAKLRGEDFFVRLEEGDAIKETYEHLV